jgi:hypothetical protein
MRPRPPSHTDLSELSGLVADLAVQEIPTDGPFQQTPPPSPPGAIGWGRGAQLASVEKSKNPAVKAASRRATSTGEAAIIRGLQMRRMPPALRALYEKSRRTKTSRPAFTSLPAPLVWPGIELKVLAVLATGLQQSACGVIGAACAGHVTATWWLVLAAATCTLVLGSYLHQGYKLYSFLHNHNEKCWTPSEPLESKAELDDPLFAMLTNLSRGVVPPMARERGAFETPEEDNLEPGRTERALQRFFSPFNGPAFRHVRPGDGLADLETWLADAAGTRRGIWYLFFMAVHQLVVASYLGFFQANQWAQASVGSIVLLSLLIMLQLAAMLWSVSRTANDRLDGVEKATGYGLEMIACLLLLVSAAITLDAQPDHQAAEGMNKEERYADLTLSLQLASASANVLMVAVFFPIGIAVHNSFIVPFAQKVWGADGNAREVCCQTLMSCILLPYSVVTTFVSSTGLGGIADIVSELEGAAVDSAAASKDMAQTLEEDSETSERSKKSPSAEGNEPTPVHSNVSGEAGTKDENDPPSEDDEPLVQHGPSTSGTLRKLKRQAYIMRVRNAARMAAGPGELQLPSAREAEGSPHGQS